MKAPPTKEAAAPAETGTAERNEERIHNASQPAKGKQQKHRPFVPAWLDDAGLSAAEMRVFIHLLRSADNKTGVAWPSYRRMIEITGLSKTTIRRCIESLENPHALIAKLGKPFGGSCRYKVLPIVPPQGQKEDSNSSTTGAIEAAPIVPPQTRNSSTTGTPIVPLQGQEGNPKKVLHRSKSNTYQLPFDSDAFKAAWHDWLDYRKEIKKPVTDISAKTHFKQFTEWGEQRTITAIESSIRNGWQGIFEPRSSNTPAKPQAEINTQLRPAIIEEI